MASLTTRRSRVHAGNPAQVAPAPEQPERWALRKAWFGLAHSAALSRTATALMGALWDRTNMAPLRDRRGMQPRYWLLEGVHVLKVWPSEETLAKELGCDQRTVRRAMKELTERGLVERQRRSGGAPEHRSGPNRASVTLIRVPTPERMPAFRLRLHGTAAELAAAARRDPATAAALLTSTAGTIDGILQQVAAGQRAWAERAKRMSDEVVAMIVRLAHGGVGVVQAERGTLLTDAESLPTVQDTPARDNPCQEAEMTATVQDKNVLPYRTKMSSPSQSLKGTIQKPNQGDGTQSTPAAGADEVGLVCFAGQTADPAEPSDPACPVGDATEVDADTFAGIRERLEAGFRDPSTRNGMEMQGVPRTHLDYEVARWKDRMGLLLIDTFRPVASRGRVLIVQHNPEATSAWKFHHTKAGGLPHFQAWVRYLLADSRWVVVEAGSENDPRPEVIEAKRRLAQQRREDWESRFAREREQASAGFPEMHGESPLTPAPRSSNGLIERMVENRVSREIAEALYEQHQRDPERIRQVCFDAERGVKEGTCRNPAGLIVSKLNKAAARSSSGGGYSWAS